MRRASAGAMNCVFDQIPNLQNCFTTLNQKPRGPHTDKRLPPRPFTGQFLRKADIKDWSPLVIWSMLHRSFTKDDMAAE